MRIQLLAIAMAAAIGAISAQDPLPPTSASLAATAPPPRQLCSTPSSQPADTVCVDRATVIKRTLAANPNLRIAAALVAQARARKVQDKALPEPDFSAEWDESKGVFGSGGASTRAVGATITIPFIDKFRLRGKIGAADVASAEADSVQTRQQLAALASASYDNLLAALQRRDDLVEIKTLSDEFLKHARDRLAAGTVAKLDVIKAEVEAARATNDLIAAGRDVTTARASLNRLMGRSLDAGLETADSLTVPPALPSLDLLVQEALRNRPELASLRSQQEGARAATGLAKRFWTPDLIVGIGRDYADPGPGVITTGVALPIPIFYWQHAKGEIAEARNHENELEATGHDLRAAIGEEVRSIFASADAAIRQATFLGDRVLPATREAYRIASSSYALGGSSALEVLDARRSLLDAENEYTAALAAANTSRADLERAVATPLSTLHAGANR